jgi:hypothetical protein
MVMMRLPILRDQINLDIARAWFLLAKLEHGSAKIRASLVIPETGMQHANRLSIHGAEFVAAQALVVPDILQQPFGWMRGVALAQERPRLLLRAPLSVKVRSESEHGL